MSDGPSLRQQRLLAVAAIALASLAFGLIIEEGETFHYDHVLFQGTVDYMKAGEGYYDAMERAFGDAGVTSARETAYRYPTLFLLWRVIPADLLWPAFLAFVVVLTSAALVRLTAWPLIAVPVAIYVLGSGHIPSGGDQVESWLLVEFWTLPALAWALVMHRERRWWPAAGLALLAAITRETTVLLLLGGLLFALVRRLPRLPWLAALAGFAAVTAVHFSLAAQRLETEGNDAPLLGTGQLPDAFFHMVAWLLPGPEVVGLVLWLLALYRVRRLGELMWCGPLLALPLTGVVVNRPYWGLVVVPFTIFWSAELLFATVTEQRARRGSPTAREEPAGSSPGARGS